VLTLVAGSFLAACGSTGTGPTTAQLDTTVRDCSMVGSGGLAADYRRRALVLGPLALGNLRTYKPDQPLPGTVGPRRGAYEVIAIVKAGSAPVLTLPRTEWGTVGLLYDPAQFRDDGAYLLKNTTHAVRFRACTSVRFNGGVSQFDGGLVVTRPQCVRVLVTTPDGRRYQGEFPAAAPCPPRRRERS
jgi:hypothetical protein